MQNIKVWISCSTKKLSKVVFKNMIIHCTTYIIIIIIIVKFIYFYNIWPSHLILKWKKFTINGTNQKCHTALRGFFTAFFFKNKKKIVGKWLVHQIACGFVFTGRRSHVLWEDLTQKGDPAVRTRVNPKGILSWDVCPSLCRFAQYVLNMKRHSSLIM